MRVQQCVRVFIGMFLLTHHAQTMRRCKNVPRGTLPFVEQTVKLLGVVQS